MTDRAEMSISKMTVKLANAIGKSVLPEDVLGIVKQHSIAGTASSLIPAPGAGFAAQVANIWSMYARINSIVGINLSEYDGKLVAKTIASGVMGNFAGTAAMAILGEGLKFIPLFGTFAGTVLTGGIFYAMTIVSALVYLKVLCLLTSKKLGVNSGTVEDAVKTVFQENKSELESIYNDSKNSYKPSK